jgi:ABC-2 type transport system ATP-binding protein
MRPEDHGRPEGARWGTATSAAPSDVMPAIDVGSSDRLKTPPGPGTGGTALEVRRLGKRFGERAAFEDVSFAVEHGEIFGFLGPNGAGKTTMVRTLGTLIAPSDGSAEVAGLPLTNENAAAIRQRIAIMPESPGLYLPLSVAENLELFARLYGLRRPAARIQKALDTVRLGPRADDPCSSLSKGLRQRVGLARALLNDPVVLFLDEPTSGLDPVAAREVHDLIRSLRDGGVTVFLTTHRLEEAERLCDRVAFLNTRLRSVGHPADLRAQLFHGALRVQTIAPLPDPDGVFRGIAGVEAWHCDGPGSFTLVVSDPRAAAPAVNRRLVAAGADVVFLGEVQHSLEDVYMELIAEDGGAVR